MSRALFWYEKTEAFKKLKSFDLKELDEFETFTFNAISERGQSKEQALQIMINQMEGDYSQLSPKLAEIAEAEDKEESEKQAVLKEDTEYDWECDKATEQESNETERDQAIRW